VPVLIVLIFLVIVVVQFAKAPSWRRELACSRRERARVCADHKDHA